MVEGFLIPSGAVFERHCSHPHPFQPPKTIRKLKGNPRGGKFWLIQLEHAGGNESNDGEYSVEKHFLTF